MDKKTKALKLALEALEKSRDRIVEQGGSGWKLHAQQCVNAITAIREALAEQPAQQQQEPVALETVYETIIRWDEGGGKRSRRELARRIVDLYTSPQQQEPADKQKYQLLTLGEKIKRGDEVLDDDAITWHPLAGWEIGTQWGCHLMPMRRAIKD